MKIEVSDLVYAPGGPGAFTLRLPGWTLPSGAQAAVEGPSGCGKTTLLELLSGQRLPGSGRVALAGQAWSELDPAPRRARRLASVGLVLQEAELVPYLDLGDNVALPARLLGGGAGPARDRARELLELVGLEGMGHRRPGTLSSGERQRVAIARALVTAPAVVLADEPTASLDPARTAQVVALLRRLCGEGGQTLVVVSHDPAVVSGFSEVLRLPTGGPQ